MLLGISKIQGEHMNYIKVPVDNAEAMINQHSFLKKKNDDMAKAAFAQMKEFVETASYHQSQIDMLSKAVKDVTFMLNTKPAASLAGSDTGSTGEGSSSSTPVSNFVDDGKEEKVTVRKADLINSLKAHESQFGSFDIDVNVIADFLMAK
jgi:hypothetical protein